MSLEPLLIGDTMFWRRKSIKPIAKAPSSPVTLNLGALGAQLNHVATEVPKPAKMPPLCAACGARVGKAGLKHSVRGLPEHVGRLRSPRCLELPVCGDCRRLGHEDRIPTTVGLGGRLAGIAPEFAEAYARLNG